MVDPGDIAGVSGGCFSGYQLVSTKTKASDSFAAY